MRYIAYSKALHSNWVLSREYATLFDCGEGCATSLGDLVFAAERIVVTHEHADHIAGLPNFLNVRNNSRGSNQKPLAIGYPKGNRELEEWVEFSRRRVMPRFPVTLHPMEPGERLTMPLRAGSREKRFLEAFSVQHGNAPCLGYRVVVETKQIKPEFSGRPPEFFRSLASEAKEEIYQRKTVTRVLYTGDTMPLPSGPDSPLWQAEVVFHDVTFLAAADRDDNTHASLDEVVETCRACQIGQVFAMHLSVRYSDAEVEKRTVRLREEFPGLRLLPRGEMVEIE